jgi:TRAP-type C4-dicarboxylate transport system permease small subunit
MLRIGRVSDMTGLPMWIPHGTVAVGFGLVLIVAAWRLVRMARSLAEPSLGGEAKP